MFWEFNNLVSLLNCFESLIIYKLLKRRRYRTEWHSINILKVHRFRKNFEESKLRRCWMCQIRSTQDVDLRFIANPTKQFHFQKSRCLYSKKMEIWEVMKVFDLLWYRLASHDWKNKSVRAENPKRIRDFVCFT